MQYLKNLLHDAKRENRQRRNEVRFPMRDNENIDFICILCNKLGSGAEGER
jgi:hypothetical protein